MLPSSTRRHGDMVTWWHADIVTWWHWSPCDHTSFHGLIDMVTWWHGAMVTWIMVPKNRCHHVTMSLCFTHRLIHIVTWWHSDMVTMSPDYHVTMLHTWWHGDTVSWYHDPCHHATMSPCLKASFIDSSTWWQGDMLTWWHGDQCHHVSLHRCIDVSSFKTYRCVDMQHINMPTHRQTTIQTYRHTERQTCKHGGMVTNMQTYRKTDIRWEEAWWHCDRCHHMTMSPCHHITMSTCRWVDEGSIQTYRHTEIHKYRHTDRQTCRRKDIKTYSVKAPKSRWRKHGDMVTWWHGYMVTRSKSPGVDEEAWRHGDMMTRRQGDTDTIRRYIDTSILNMRWVDESMRR